MPPSARMRTRWFCLTVGLLPWAGGGWSAPCPVAQSRRRDFQELSALTHGPPPMPRGRGVLHNPEAGIQREDPPVPPHPGRDRAVHQ